MKFVQK